MRLKNKITPTPPNEQWMSLKMLNKFTYSDCIYFLVATSFCLISSGNAPPLIALGLATIVWLVSRQYPDILQLVKHLYFRPVFLLLFLPWIGLIYSDNITSGLDYALKTKYLFLLIIMFGLSLNPDRLNFIVYSFFAGLTAGALFAGIQLAGIIPPIDDGHLGFGIVHTQISMYLIIGILSASFYFKNSLSKKKRIAFLILIAIFIFHLAVMEGRSGYIIFIILSPIIIQNLLFLYPVRLKLIGIAILILSLSFSPTVRNKTKETITEWKVNKEKIVKGDFVKKHPRFFFIRTSIEALLENPVLGLGTGGFAAYSEKKGHQILHPHNSLLYMGVSFGFLGIFSYLWMIFLMLKNSWLKRGSPAGFFTFSIGLVIFLGGFFDTHILNTGTLILYILGYGLLFHIDRLDAYNLHGV